MSGIDTKGSFFAKNTLLSEYMAHLAELSSENKSYYEQKYKKNVDEKDKDSIFLSVIMRTQGKRIDELRECFLCLEAQTDDDFEIILICHKVTEENVQKVKTVIEEQSDRLNKKILFLELNEGTRATPINYGISYARGRYFAIYDDDDILFDNWVESFHIAAEENEGKLLHAFTFSQKWEKNNKTGYGKGLAAIAAPVPQFCESFNLIRQFSINKCPLMSIAFPTFLFNEYGIIFDETLDVTEDWEYIMRVAPICGVYDIKDVTSIYRLWTNSENSYSLHNQKVWDDIYSRIRERIFSSPMLLNVSPEENFESQVNSNGIIVTNALSAGYPRMLGVLFYDTGNGFSDGQMIVADNESMIPYFQMTFNISQIEKQVIRYRFDPCEFGGIMINEFEIELKKEGKIINRIGYNGCTCNGIVKNKSLYFLHYDPQILWRNDLKSFEVDQIVVRGYVTMEVPENVIVDAINLSNKEIKFNRFYKLIKRFFR